MNAPISYQEYPIQPPLSEFVKCLWFLQKTFSVEDNCETVLPDSYFEYINNLGDPFYILEDGIKRFLPPTFTIGILKAPLELYCDGEIRIIAARLYPWGARYLLGESIHDFCKRGLNTHFRLNAELFPAALKEAEARQHLEHLLSNKWSHHKQEKEVITEAIKLLYTNTDMKIEDLADYLFKGKRSIQIKFQSDYGTTAKRLSLNFRFDKLKQKLMENPSAELKQLALEFGYTDPSHFTKDFKAFSGMTPTAFCHRVTQLRDL